MDEPLIELKEITKVFGNNIILDQVNLKIYPGDSLGVIGPSGTGKSTILRIIAGLMKPDTGEVYFKGKKRTATVEDQENPIGIGMVFQQAALFDSLTVAENVGFLLYQHSKLPRKKIRQLVDEKLALVGLAGKGDLYPAEISGGMKKRVSFARAIMSNPDSPKDTPEILLYDEPTAGLDPIASTVIEDLIRDLQKNSGCKTYLMVTHQHSTIKRTTDRIIFLFQGKIQWEGTTAKLKNSNNPSVTQFLRGDIAGPIKVI